MIYNISYDQIPRFFKTELTEREVDGHSRGYRWVFNGEFADVSVFVVERCESEDEMLAGLFDEVLAGFFAQREVVHQAAAARWGFLDNVPFAQHLKNVSFDFYIQI